MDRQESLNFEQLLPNDDKSKPLPLPSYRPHLESQSTAFTTASGSYSIQSVTPQTFKGKHTMTSNAHPAAIKFKPYNNAMVDLEKSNHPEGMHRDRAVSMAAPSLLKAQQLIQVRGLKYQPPMSRKSADASTQVFTQNLKGLYSTNYNLSTEICDFADCIEAATGGKCDYRVCCSTGCQRKLCSSHLAASAKVEEADTTNVHDDYNNAELDVYSKENENQFSNRVCIECESRANRAFWITIFFVIAVPVMAAMPAIFLYGGVQE